MKSSTFVAGAAKLTGTCLLALGSATHLRAAEANLVQTDDPYFKQAQEQLQANLTLQNNTNRAKNVILFVGDGMGFSTVTATRIFEGQQRGIDGESTSWPGRRFRIWRRPRPIPRTRRSPIPHRARSR